MSELKLNFDHSISPKDGYYHYYKEGKLFEYLWTEARDIGREPCGEPVGNSGSPEDVVETLNKYQEDWIVMHNELTDLRQNLKEAVVEIEKFGDQKFTSEKIRAFKDGIEVSLNILRKHNLIEEE